MNTKLFDITFSNMSEDKIIMEFRNVLSTDKKLFIHTVNVDHIIRSKRDVEFRKVMDSAHIITPDGMPIVVTSKLKKGGIKERVTGADLTIELLKNNCNSFNVYLLGAAPGVAEKAKALAHATYENANVVGTYSPSRTEVLSEVDSEKIIDKINSSGANCLLVALGSPLQEEWISKNIQKLNTQINIGVGASIDFVAGVQRRAPAYIQKIGFEWLHRLLSNPKRMFNRYIVTGASFLPILITELIKKEK
ncbi:WecB/TagA/CpsF family glycosyltransferase [Fusibacter sp. JL216-2]|uniref:WecB/TagA/CpsF family glycosyltransferase n=1 Tax=Fusibacter sp. JL216-2 TaxID=3071453 RepID=UPI003D33989C